MTQKLLNPIITTQIMTTLPHKINASSDQLKFSSTYQNESMDTNSKYFIYPMTPESINNLNFNTRNNIIPNNNYDNNNQSNEYPFSNQSLINYQNSNFNSDPSQIQISPSLKPSLYSYQPYAPKLNQCSTSFLKSNANSISTAGHQRSSQKQKKIRKLFSVEEDHLLTRIMYGQPFTTWIAVAAQIPGRSARQCRDRWANYLSPNNKNGPWSQVEDEILAAKHREYGSQWSIICKFFNGRSENNVKNRWYTHLKPKYFSEDQINNFTKIRSINPNINSQFSNNITNTKNFQNQENDKNNDFNFLSYCSSQPISGLYMNNRNSHCISDTKPNTFKKLSFSENSFYSNQPLKAIHSIPVLESSNNASQSNLLSIRNDLSDSSMKSFNENNITYSPSSSQNIDMNQKRVQLPPISSFVPDI